jgi:Flp pilus assembly pilin Flp
MRNLPAFRKLVEAWTRCRSGGTAVEYSLIAFAMFGALIPAFLYVASGMSVKFAAVTDYFKMP